MIGRRLRPNEVRRPSFYRRPGPKSGMGTPRNISPGRVFQLMRYTCSDDAALIVS
jgi:hypothetical protein